MALDVNCTCKFWPPLYVASASCQSGIYGIPSGKDGGMVRTVVRYYQHFTLRLQVNHLAFTRKIYVAHASRCHICPKMTVRYWLLRTYTVHIHVLQIPQYTFIVGIYNIQYTTSSSEYSNCTAECIPTEKSRSVIGYSRSVKMVGTVSRL